MVEVRLEQASDIEEIRHINDLAFGQPEEGLIVDRLRENCEGVLSLVAVVNGRIVGHILFSPVILEGKRKNIQGMGLAPMAVLPEFQNQGIGSKLVVAGIKILKNPGCPFIIVLGHEKYYPRFGFQPASLYNIKCQWEGVPNEAFMVLVFNKDAIEGVSGVVRYRDEFNEASKAPRSVIKRLSKE